MTLPWRFETSLSPEVRVAVLNFLNQTEARLGREAIDENRRRAVQHGLTGNYWIAEQDGVVTGFGMAEMAPQPTVELAGGVFDATLAAQLLERFDTVDWWLRDGSLPPRDVPVQRTLRFMTREGLSDVSANVPFTVRPFEPGVDESAWLAQNNAAFASHPEQGTWDLATIRQRISEPWFDPSGFLLLFDNDTLVASCWTKIHEMHSVRVGVIYVISVHPEFQGRGLGRQALHVGLDSIRRRGVYSASLYVEDSNHAAVRLYESENFTTQRRDHVVRLTRP